jgi:hypothetical protein
MIKYKIMETMNSSKTRPTLLTVVCIISYVLLGFSILNGFTGAIFGTLTSTFEPVLEKIIERDVHLDEVPMGVRSLVEDSFDVAYKAMEHATTMSLLSLLLSVIALFGVIMMWQLKKTGFYLYTGAKIFILLIPLIFLGLNFITFIAVTSTGMFAIVFIILFAVNLKHMK